MNKRIIVLACACGILLLTWAIGLYVAPEAQARRRKARPLIVLPETQEIVSISLGDTLLQQEEAIWTFETLPAREDRIIGLIEDLQAAKDIGSVGNRNDSYGLRPERTIVIDIDQREPIQLELGNRVSGSPYLYAVLNDSENVLKTNNKLDFYFRQSVQYWQDLRLYPENIRPDRDEVVQVVVSNGSNEFILSRSIVGDLPAWYLDEMDPAISDVSNAYVRTFFNLEASELVPVSQEISEENEILRVSVRVQTGAVFETILYSRDDSDTAYARPSGLRNEFLFVLAPAIQERLARDRSYFVE